MKKRSLVLLSVLMLVVSTVLPVTVNRSVAQDGDLLAPDGEPGVSYYAPFTLPITLDGDLSDWAGVPRVTMSDGGDPGIEFAVAADDTYLYLMADVIDSTIISGTHGADYWNEDSVEFYLNATGNLGLRSYTEGAAQITIPAMNKDLGPDEVIISGVNGTTVSAVPVVVETETGYAMEVSVPLQNDVWDITVEHGQALGFQVHLNAARETNRDTKLIWSVFDTSDQSYQNPSVFGFLIFYEIGREDVPPLPDADAGRDREELPEVEADALYLDPTQPVDARVEDLLARMSLYEKIGQMTQVENGSIVPEDITNEAIGSILSGGGGAPDVNTPAAWAAMTDGYQQYALETRLGIPLIYGVDAVHGHNNVYGAVIFPHNIGLGATRNAELVEEICRITALEMVATGTHWNFAPVLAVLQDARWGRYYEGYGEDTDLVTELSVACVEGLQGDSLADPLTVLATPKHFVGDGGAVWGTGSGDYDIDQGVTDVDEDTLRAIHLPPYQAAVDAGAQNVMISFSSWGGMKMHGQQYLITDVLKGEFGFEGFIISDWAGVDQIASDDYYLSVVTSINAGVDMVMVPYDYIRFIDTLALAVENGDV
ncbi:MAG: hypothetical protein GYB65_24320, partial [Chloroflexi bacterium]|nr:hypothetical protein [Chloroflexota bacterium]